MERRIQWQKFLAAMESERRHQIKQWGDGHDAKNTPSDWVAVIARHLGLAVLLPWNRVAFRKAMVKIAAVCAAAYEWAEDMPRRHFD